jgi:SAM-dependent methyltransferase
MAAIAQHSRVPVQVAAFERWDVAGRAFDAVVSGQAWHWIDPVAGAAKAAEALRPGGLLALFWNVFALTGELAAVHRRVVPELPLQTGPDLEQARAGLAGAFADVQERRFEWEQVYTRDEWVDQLQTHAPINRLPPERVQALLAELGGSFAVPYTSLLLSARRI